MTVSKTEPVTRTKPKEGCSMQIKTRDLTGAALDWAVAKCEGFVLPDMTHSLYDWFKAYGPRYSTDWAQGGPIIEREKIDCVADPNGKDVWMGRLYATRLSGEKVIRAYGPTPLIAAMRCYVASKLGEEVGVPDVLDAD